MNIKGEYVLREIGGDYILVPVGQAAMEINGLITMDELGVVIWKGIEAGLDDKQILQTVLDNYDVEEDEAKKDICEFMEKLLEAGLVIK